ncbi:type II secretion system protein N (GspN) [Sphingomonas gellani]|uniref:Type II secretion system protein N n=1 Tax=Sphingomonas gellani TaxID=1166340 RepID=A0A1H7Y9N0_9SPHN|nr:type II secretion system protein N [Sphingomonas gellani]SEM42574.1 type II secretion system protein N (GspN) [Sphingomonas gellani]
MRRIRLRAGPSALFGMLLAAALLLFLPLRLVLGWLDAGSVGLTARSAGGSVWAGSLTDAHLGRLALGDLRAHLSPWSLLIGRARVELDGRGDAADRLRGAVTVSRHRAGLDDFTASLATGALFAPLPVTRLDLDAVSVHFADGGCRDAVGRVTVALSPGAAGIALPATLTGTPRCDGTALLLPLVSTAGSESVTVRMSSAGSYSARFLVRPSDPAAAQKLEAAGFAPSADGHQLSIEGRF